jgi:hypothetical protein
MRLYGMREDKFKFREVKTVIKGRCSIVRSTECTMRLHTQLIFVVFIIMIVVLALELKLKMLTTF